MDSNTLPNWTAEANELEQFFQGYYMPNSIIISHYETIVDVDKFIESHLAAIRTHNGKPWFIPYLDRLRYLKQFMEENREGLLELKHNPLNNRIE